MLEARVFKSLEFQHSNLWVSYLMKPPYISLLNFKGENFVQTAANAAVSTKNLISLGLMPFLTQSVELPFPGLTAERQHGVNYLTDEDIQYTVSMTFFETEDWQMTRMFKDWMKSYYNFKDRCFDFSLFQGGVQSFKTFCVLAFLGKNAFKVVDPTLSWAMGHIPTKLFLLEGMFPIKIEPLHLEYNSGEPIKISVTFAVDRIIDDSDDAILASAGVLMQAFNNTSKVMSMLS